MTERMNEIQLDTLIVATASVLQPFVDKWLSKSRIKP